jgi:uncharacterized protein (DUF2336 family)
VRLSLAQNLRHSRTAPRPLILKLANDKADSVATPILQSSPLLEEEDLSEIIQKSSNPVRLIAIAERRMLSVTLSALLTAKQYESVCLALLANPTSTIDSSTYLTMAKNHIASPLILQQMLKRSPLPQEAIRQMQQATESSGQENTAPSEPAAKSKIASFGIPPHQQEMRDLLQRINALGQEYQPEACHALAADLHHQHRLTLHNLLLILGCGQLELFYACIAEATETPLHLVGMEDTDQRDRLNNLLMKAGISASLMPLLLWALQGAVQKREQGIAPSSRQMYKLMSIRLYEGARRGVNFASTMGTPVATLLESLV